MVSTFIYLCLHHLPCDCHTLVPEIHVCPEMFHVLLHYSNAIIHGDKCCLDKCIIHNCMHLSKQQGRLNYSVCRQDYRRRQVGGCADTWYKHIQPIEILEL